MRLASYGVHGQQAHAETAEGVAMRMDGRDQLLCTRDFMYVFLGHFFCMASTLHVVPAAGSVHYTVMQVKQHSQRFALQSRPPPSIISST